MFNYTLDITTVYIVGVMKGCAQSCAHPAPLKPCKMGGCVTLAYPVFHLVIILFLPPFLEYYAFLTCLSIRCRPPLSLMH